MNVDPQNLEVLVSVPNEIEAAAILNALQEHGIKAVASGGYTSGFKAEAPGEVKVLVKHGDTDRAQTLLSQIRSGQGQIDWTNFDVGDPE